MTAPAKPRKTATRRARSKSIHRRAEILREAKRLFDIAGFHETSLDDIARAVGIRREGLYYYYRNRADILLDIVRPQNEALVARMGEIVTSKRAPSAKLLSAIKMHLSMFDRTALDLVVLGIGGQGDPEVDAVHAEVAPFYRVYQDYWIALLREGQRDGSFDRTMDPKLTVFAILGMCNWTGVWLDTKGALSQDEIAVAFHKLISRGLGRTSPNTGRRAGTK